MKPVTEVLIQPGQALSSHERQQASINFHGRSGAGGGGQSMGTSGQGQPTFLLVSENDYKYEKLKAKDENTRNGKNEECLFVGIMIGVLLGWLLCL